MPESGPSYGTEQRKRVIDDLSRWKIRYELFDISTSSLEAWHDYLDRMDGDGLRDTWYGCVGEWLCSRDDLSIHERDTDEYLDEQFQSLISGEGTEYGFVA